MTYDVHRLAGIATQTSHANMSLSLPQAASNMQQFMRSNALSPMVMVCTDRSSRGMDFDRAEVSVFHEPLQAATEMIKLRFFCGSTILIVCLSDILLPGVSCPCHHHRRWSTCCCTTSLEILSSTCGGLEERRGRGGRGS